MPKMDIVKDQILLLRRYAYIFEFACNCTGEASQQLQEKCLLC